MPSIPGGMGSPVRMTGMSIVRIGAAGRSTAGGGVSGSASGGSGGGAVAAATAPAAPTEAPSAATGSTGVSGSGGGGGGAVTAGWILVGSQRR